jgi:hypothetical protein
VQVLTPRELWWVCVDVLLSDPLKVSEVHRTRWSRSQHTDPSHHPACRIGAGTWLGGYRPLHFLTRVHVRGYARTRDGRASCDLDVIAAIARLRLWKGSVRRSVGFSGLS